MTEVPLGKPDNLSEEVIARLSVGDVTLPDQEEASKHSYKEGDIVNVDGGLGVVSGKFQQAFEWDGTEYEATAQKPLYVVALVKGGSGIYKPGDLSLHDGSIVESKDADPKKLAEDSKLADFYSLMDDPEDIDEYRGLYEELANIPGVDDPEVGFAKLPKGWSRKSVLQAWASLGGTWRSCFAKMSKKKGSKFAKRWCSAMKDEVLGTESWRSGGKKKKK